MLKRYRNYLLIVLFISLAAFTVYCKLMINPYHQSLNLTNIINKAFLFALLIIAALIILVWRLSRQKHKILISMDIKLEKLVKEKTKELLETNEKLNTLINTAPSPVFYKNKEGIYRECNEAFAKMILGLPKKKIIGNSLYNMPDRISVEMAELYHSMDMEMIKNPGTQFYEAKVKCADNIYRDFFFNKATITDSEGYVTGIVGIMIDITERKKAEEALIESKERFKMLLNASFGGIVIHEQGVLIDANKEMCDISGYTYKELKEMDSLIQLIAPEWQDNVMEHILSKDEAFYDIEGIRKDGTKFPLEIQAKTIPYEGRILRVAGLRDISDRHKARKVRDRLLRKLQKTNKKLKRLSVTDALTGLNNRGYIFERFTTEILKAKRHKNDLSIIMIDIDHFKNINDTYGHIFGDYVLKKISKTFKNTIREIDIVGRYGGEEFLIILPNTNQDQGHLLAERIRKNIASLEWEHDSLRITISGGLAQYKGESKTELLKIADSQLYKAKETGRNRIERTA